MKYTIADYLPYIDYAGYSHTSTIKGTEVPLKEILVNKVKYNPKIIKSGIGKPIFSSINGGLYIQGAASDIVFASRFIDDNPNESYEVHHIVYKYAKEKYEAIYGYDPDLEALPDEEPTKGLEECKLVTLEEDINVAAVDLISKVRDYIKEGGKNVTKAACLIGHSGISKSALVYQVAKDLNKEVKWGCRVVELKGSFLDKSDLIGFAEVKDDVYFDSPNKSLLTCSDAFIIECRNFLQNNIDETEENRRLIKKMKYYARTPILYLDEINRVPESVQNQLMNLINTSKLHNYTFKLCVKVASGNVPIDLDFDDEEKEELIQYLVEDVKDLATATRFDVIKVSHTDRSVQDSNYMWQIENAKSALSQDIIEHAYDKLILHNPTLIDDNGKFPTFRSWEHVTQYIDWVAEKPDTKPLFEVISGLVGINAANEISKLVTYDYSKSTDTFIEHNMESGLPTILLGRLGIGKTAKLNNYTKKSGAVVSHVDLSSEDRATVGGMPEPADFLTNVFSTPIPTHDREDIADNYEDEMKIAQQEKDIIDTADFRAFKDKAFTNKKLPKRTTKFVPHEETQRLVDEARASGKKLILYCDELNRCSPIVQSAVFEIISNKKFRGVDLTGVDFSVVAAGNWQSQKSKEEYGELYGSAQPVGTATLHRFCAKFIEEVSTEDLDSFLDYLNKNNPRASKLLKDISKPELIKMLNYLPSEGENIDIDSKVFSFREVEGLERLLRMYEFPVISAKSISELDEVIEVLKSEKYILNLPDFKDFYNFRESPGLKKFFLFGGEKFIKSDQFIPKVLAFLEHPRIPQEHKVDLLTYLKLKEKKALEVIDRNVNNEFPSVYAKDLTIKIKNLLEENTDVLLNVDVVGDLFSKDDAVVKKTLEKILAKGSPEKALDTLLTFIFQGIEDSDSKIKSSQIKKVIELYEKTNIGSLVDFPLLPLMEKVQFIKDKIENDSFFEYEVDLNDLSESSSKILDTFCDSFEGTIKEQLSFIPIPAGDDTAIFSAFQLKDYNNRSLILNDSLLTLVKKEDTNDGVSLVFEGALGCLKVKIKGVVLDLPASLADLADSASSFISDEDPSLAVGAKMIQDVYGGVLKDLPISDVKSLDELGVREFTRPHRPYLTDPDLRGIYLMIFRKMWNIVNKNI